MKEKREREREREREKEREGERETLLHKGSIWQGLQENYDLVTKVSNL